MDYYPQPRPVLYGTSAEETPAQTLTAPVRIGPPRYPPAPPMAGDAPDPFDPPPMRLMSHKDRVTVSLAVLAVLYVFTSAYSLLQVMLGTTLLASSNVGQMALTAEIVIGPIVIASLILPGGRPYLLAVGLVALHVSIGIALAQWQSPAFWVAMIVLLYLLTPSMRKQFGRMARLEVSSDVTGFRSQHPRRQAHFTHSLKHTTHQSPGDRRIPWRCAGFEI
jgi:hypothetical protein